MQYHLINYSALNNTSTFMLTNLNLNIKLTSHQIWSTNKFNRIIDEISLSKTDMIMIVKQSGN